MATHDRGTQQPREALESATRDLSPKAPQARPYQVAELHDLGSLEQIQGFTTGMLRDAMFAYRD